MTAWSRSHPHGEADITDTNAADAPAQDTDTDHDTGPDNQPEDAPAQDTDTDWKTEARKWEARAKANADARAELDKIEQANKSEIEKAREAAVKAEARAAALEAESLRTQVAAAKGLNLEMAGRLVGSTIEELEADADKLLSMIQTAASSKPADVKQGNRGGNTASGTSPNDWLRSAAKQRSG